jgi:hypothetical protein
MPQGFIPLSKQMDFLWNEVQGKEKSGFGKFLTAGASTPEDYATLWDKYYERSGGAGDEKARNYASSVYAAMADGASNEALISPNAKFAYGYLTQKGLTPQQAAGITGRLMAESYEDMNPDARNTLAGGKGTYGVAQWRGSRLQDLADFTGVDIGDITSLPATKPGGGLLTSNQGGQTMPDQSKLPYMMGGEQTYNAPNMRQPAPQQGGMRGLLSTLKDAATAVDPNTGLTGYQRFARALDPLIMPEMRAGAAIEKQGAARVAADRRNKTVEMLRLRKRDDLADMVERGMISPTDAASQLLAGKKKPIVVGGKLIDPDTFEVLYGTPAPEGGDFKDASAFRKEFTNLPRIKSFAGVTEAYSRIVASAQDPSAAGDLALIFNYMKVLDPGSTVREGEFATAQNAGGVDARVRSLFNSVVDGTRLTSEQRADFLDRSNRLYKSQESLVLPLYEYYGNIASSRGFDPERVLPKFGYTGDMPQVAPEFSPIPVPPVPEGATANGQPLTQDAWTAIWNARTAEEKRKWLATGAFE